MAVATDVLDLGGALLLDAAVVAVPLGGLIGAVVGRPEHPVAPRAQRSRWVVPHTERATGLLHQEDPALP